MISISATNNFPAPIALFVYNRPIHTRKLIESLLENIESKDTQLFIFSDAAKDKNSIDSVEKVRAYVNKISGFKSITIIPAEHNKGLANSLIDGISYVLERNYRVIVLEDDLVVSPYFLRYMNSGLDVYRDEKQVASIHGYCYPTMQIEADTFFLRGADCWGWATWRRAWNYFESDGQKLLSMLEQAGLMKKFDLDGAYPYVRMLKDQIKGKNNSWAIRWHASCFIKNMMTLYPAVSLVQNIGNDNSGTHCSVTNAFDVVLANHPIQVKKIEVRENMEARNQVAIFFKYERSLFRRVWSKLKIFLLKLGFE